MLQHPCGGTRRLKGNFVSGGKKQRSVIVHPFLSSMQKWKSIMTLGLSAFFFLILANVCCVLALFNVISTELKEQALRKDN